MKRKVFIEGIIFALLGFIGLYEGIRLMRARDLTVVQDPLGSDGYIIMIGLALIIAGVTHIIANYKKTDTDKGKVIVGEEEKGTLLMVVKIFASLAVTCLLINFIGYLLSTLIFFLLMFQIFGFKWSMNAMLSVGLSVAFWLIFEYFLTMSFPRGTLIAFPEMLF